MHSVRTEPRFPYPGFAPVCNPAPLRSILHDIVNYKDQASAAAAQNLGRWSYGTGPGTLGTTACAPTNASEVFRQKYRPVHQFEEVGSRQCIWGYSPQPKRLLASCGTCTSIQVCSFVPIPHIRYVGASQCAALMARSG